ncbi:MAG: sigma-70 family RNA polymerase sigma factor [Terriglobales bacterium]
MATESIRPLRNDIEAAYREFRPVLLRALGALAKNGFAIPPSDALDLVHDFFVDKWSTVDLNYDGSKGPLASYLYIAFVHYARPRIVRMNRLRSALVEPGELEREQPASDRDLADVVDLANWSTAITSLPEKERRFLLDYLYESSGSERDLAERTGLSRHAVREQLVRILGRVISAYGRPIQGAHLDWNVADAIWVHDRTVHETAALLGSTPEVVRRAKARIVSALTDALRRFEGRGEIMQNTASRTEAAMTPESLLYQVLTSPGNQQLLLQLRARAGEVIAAIDDRDMTLPKGTAESIDGLWIAEVYETLATGVSAPQTPELEKLSAELFAASVEDIKSIGVAFQETLLPGLPLELANFPEWFGSVKQITPERIAELSKFPDVEAAFPISAQLIVYGLTPRTFYYATEAVSTVLDRLFRLGLAKGNSFVLHPRQACVIQTEQGEVHVDLEAEISRVAECTVQAANAILPWLVAAAGSKPLLFSGFEAAPSSNGVLLRHTTTAFDSLYKRWGVAFQYERGVLV